MLDLQQIRGFIVDMDGVLWRASEILPGTPDFFHYLDGHLPYVFATNNSTRSVANYVEKLRSLDIHVSEAQIVSSSAATAAYLRLHYPAGAAIFVVGEQGLCDELSNVGFTLFDDAEGQPDLVVAGLDRHITYEKLHRASSYIRNGAAFIGTNPDKTFPVPGGQSPGAGSIIAAIEAASGVTPRIIGKPGSPMFEVALQRLGTSPHQTLMIGDRLETDILGAQQAGIRAALVLSGVARPQDLTTIQPDAIYEDLAALLVHLKTVFGGF